MTGLHARRRSVLGLVTALTISIAGSLGSVDAPSSVARAAEATPSTWDGSVDLYRKGVFTTQGSWLWCTAAVVQIVRNIVDRDDDHSTSAQRDYFAWMRRHNRYDLPESAGVDPAGWTAGLRHFVDDRYRLIASKTFDSAIRSATERLRATGLPVALTVAHGGHGWILTGFSATADPLATDDYAIRSVRVVGPLYGLQSRNGYDMKPGTSLTLKELRRFFTPWRYAPKPMIWDGTFVSIQPVPVHRPAPTAPPAAPAPPPSASPTSPLAGLTYPSAPPAPRDAAVASGAPSNPALAPAPGLSPEPPAAKVATDPRAVVTIALGLLLAILLAVSVRQAGPRGSRSPRTRE
ncbi:MAG: hypothetical protein ACRDIL_05710 [Candidatus Limnocylindrales bacterium]